MVQIESVTAEIYLIWTNVVRTNVTETNVIVTLEIFSRWFQEPVESVFEARLRCCHRGIGGVEGRCPAENM